jgi:hypothetical protein
MTNADKVAEAIKASKAQTSPKVVTGNNNNNSNNSSSNINNNNNNNNNNANHAASKSDPLTKRAPSQTPTKLIAEVRPMSKNQDSDRKRDSDDISESEFSRQVSI